MLFSFIESRFNLSRGCTGLCFQGVGRRVACGSAGLHKQPCNQPEEKWLPAFLRTEGFREVFHRLGIQEDIELDSD
jgi:hypothetical protein